MSSKFDKIINCNGRKCEGCSFGRNRSGNCGWYFAKAIVANAIAQKSVKEKEPAPAGTGTDSKENNLHLDDTTLFEICQEGILKVIDRILLYSDNTDMYAVGYLQSIYDFLDKLKKQKGDNYAEQSYLNGKDHT